MKPTIFFVSMAAIACIAAVATDRLTSDGNRPGRYQIIPAQIEIAQNGQKNPAPEVLKIDTATGRTWIYSVELREGQLKRQWIEIAP